MLRRGVGADLRPAEPALAGGGPRRPTGRSWSSRHSCVASWFRAVRGSAAARGLALAARPERARALPAPTRSSRPAAAMPSCWRRCYPGLGPVEVVPNATGRRRPPRRAKQPFGLCRRAAGGTRARTPPRWTPPPRALDWPVWRRARPRGRRASASTFAPCPARGPLPPRGAARRVAAAAGVFVSPSHLRALRPRRAGGRARRRGAGAVGHPDLPRALGRRRALRAHRATPAGFAAASRPARRPTRTCATASPRGAAERAALSRPTRRRGRCWTLYAASRRAGGRSPRGAA